jgi:uncharacterized protein (DUF1800 family)
MLMKPFLFLAVTVSLAVQPSFGQSVSAREAARFLDQASWGPTPGSIEQVQEMGINGWLASQFALNTSTLPSQEVLNAQGKSNNNLGPVQAAFFQNTVNGGDQLRQRVAFILSQIWVVSATSGVSPAYAYPPYWSIFQNGAFGNYRDLIKAVTLSPAMGRYLNMANNVRGNPAKGTSANENYGRELMQLFTLGLTQLNLNGTPVLDSSGNPLPTYSQAEVTNMAKIVTGWTYPTAPGATAKVANPEYYIGQMFAAEAEHDTTAKTIFNNINVPAGQTAEQDLDSLLDALMAQPTMAPFISQQLIEHLVTSNPSAAYIQRIAQVFENDGSGVRGNLQAVITAILTDEEARAGDAGSSSVTANFGHLREPILLMSSVLRGLTATVGAVNGITAATTNMSQELFYEPSVFSYFSPQSRTEHGLYGPEFQIYTTQTAVNRDDTINTLIYATMPGVKVDLQPFIPYAGDTNTLLDYIARIFLRSAMSPQLQSAATTAVNAATTATTKVQAALYVVLTSSEYQVIQ